MTYFDSETSKSQLKSDLLPLLQAAVEGVNSAPGAVFGVTNEKEAVFLEAAGFADIDNQKKLSKDTIFAIFSCTKAATVTGLLILRDRGELSLDDPVSKYIPEVKKVGVVKSIDADGNYEVVAPKTEITLKHLITHTAGFGYTFFHQEYKNLSNEGKELNIFDVTDKFYDDHTFLLFEPGTKWSYGLNIDWVGKVIENISGQKLGEFLKQNLFQPLDMGSATFSLNDDENLTKLYFRNEDGTLGVNYFQQNIKPAVDLGGSGIFCNVDDYLKFIRFWLNEGKSQDGKQILLKETIKYALENHLPEGIQTTGLDSVEPDITNKYNGPQNPDLWSLPFGITQEDLPTGRPKGSHHWCGIANLFFWIDTKNKIGGFWATQILPFLDPSLAHYGKLESTVYSSINSAK